jgi:hypothetical protein
MKSVNVSLALYDPHGKPETEKALISQVLDQEIEDFSEWMAKLADIRARGPLLSGEKALLKTYLIQKIKGEF